MFIQKLMGILAVMVLSVAGAMEMEEKPLSDAQPLIQYTNFADEVIDLPDENSVVCYVVNARNCQAEIKVINLCDMKTDDDDRYFVDRWEEQIGDLKPFSLCCLRRSDLLVVERRLEDIIGNMEQYEKSLWVFCLEIREYTNKYRKERVKNKINRPERNVRSVSNCLVDYYNSQLNWAPVGTFFSFYEANADSYSYFKKLTILLNDANSPFAHLPMELRWKIGFNMLGVWAPFDRGGE